MSVVAASGSAEAHEGGGCGAAPGKRLFNLLEEESKERVLRMITALRTLTPLEQEAFAQELGVRLPETVVPSFAAGTRPLSRRALGVLSRDPGYATLAAPVAATADDVEAELAAMVRPFLTEKTLFDPPKEEKAEEERVEAVCVEEPQRPTAARLDDVCIDGRAGEEEEAASQRPVLYRSRAYQAMRLARGEKYGAPAHMYTKPAVMNVTGMPIDESDVWEWFEMMDVGRSGTVGVVPFLAAIKDLDRGFGVSEKAEAEFAEEVEALATDGQLTFEKFAFLVSRFPRH